MLLNVINKGTGIFFFNISICYKNINFIKSFLSVFIVQLYINILLQEITVIFHVNIGINLNNLILLLLQFEKCNYYSIF